MFPCWSRSDGEENVGDQEFFDDQQDQQEFVNKASIAWAYLDVLFHFDQLVMCMCLILITLRTF